ncbi:MAG TPA: hypothetical protein VKE24_03790, partial [Candidatus Acidoferrales bacterium]|nr:hypothetical protein [Candidatus Acidoferrales bacterium]
PPEPRLQGAPGHRVSPAQELLEMRAEAEAALNGYAWVDEKAGLARIPIDEAMKLVAERGLGSPGVQPRREGSSREASTPPRRTIREKRP